VFFTDTLYFICIDKQIGMTNVKKSFIVLRNSDYSVDTNCIGCHQASTVSWIPPSFTICPKIPTTYLHQFLGKRFQKNHFRHPLRCEWNLCCSEILRSLDLLSYQRFGTTLPTFRDNLPGPIFKGKCCRKPRRSKISFTPEMILVKCFIH